MPADFEGAIRFLDGLSNFETVRMPGAASAGFTLDRVRSLLEIMGHPERRFPCVHIAGTKGKGSTAAMIASVLTSSGLKVGWYTSPHFQTIRERIRIDRTMIAPDEFAKMAERLRGIVAAMPGEPPSQFEAMTAMAFDFFAAKGVDIAVIETGMGGALDATNVLVPQVSVITSISLDHTAVLGNTLPRIAAQKAGIVKERGILVTAPQKPEVMKVLSDTCARLSAEIHQGQRDWSMRKKTADLSGQSFFFAGRPFASSHDGEREFWIPLSGDHQLENAGVALEAINVLKALGIRISEEATREGLRSVVWPGRFQVIQGRPMLVLDGAHNRSSAECLRKTLVQHFGNGTRAVILGISCDKDIPGILEELLAGTSLFVATRSGHARAADPTSISDAVHRLGGRCVTAGTFEEALNAAKDGIGNDGVVCVTGSLFLVGEALSLLKYS